MPELPEVETTKRGIASIITGIKIKAIHVHNSRLRWPVPVKEIQFCLPGNKFNRVSRRAKYLLLESSTGTLIIHLGMSGSLRVLDQQTELHKHEHVEILFENGTSLRLRDPRRFGAVLWTQKPVAEHKLFTRLGPEPLSDDFDTAYLFKQSRSRRCNIKSLIMNAHIVVGVGNIYASEALFHAGIRPVKQASSLSQKKASLLVTAIKKILNLAILAGGTTLKDFTNSEGKAGYFSQSLSVYGRDGEPCLQCDTTIKRITLGQRSSFYCPYCQK